MAEEEVWAECSDEEEFDRLGVTYNGFWSPKLEEIPGLLQNIKNSGRNIELVWKCPGRRDPNQPDEPAAEPTMSKESSDNKDEEADGFDFDMDEDAAPTAKPTPKAGKFKAKTTVKKTTTLAGILSNMQRHRIIEQTDTNTTTNSAENKDPKTPS